MENANSQEYLNKIRNAVVDNIRRTGKPSVEPFMEIPSRALNRAMESDDEDEEDDLDADLNPDKRVTQRQRDQMIVADNEFDDMSDDEYKEGLGVRRQPGEIRRRGIMSFQNPDAAPDEVEVDGVRALNGETGRTTTQDTPAPVSRASSRPAANGTASAPAAVDADGDVDMGNETTSEESYDDGDGDVPAPSNAMLQTDPLAPAANIESPAPGAGVVTPPDSPPAAPAAPAPAPATAADVEMDDDARAEAVQAAKDEGLTERTAEDERGEAETEARARAAAD
jgi:histone deacetylase 1/2